MLRELRQPALLAMSAVYTNILCETPETTGCGNGLAAIPPAGWTGR